MNNPDKRGTLVGDLMVLGLVANSLVLVVVMALALTAWLR